MFGKKKPKRFGVKPRKKPVFLVQRIPPVKHKEWLNPGKQTRITKIVFDFAAGFKGSKEQIVSSALKALLSFPKQELGLGGLEEYYSKRTADEIISSGKIIVGNANAKEKFLVEGCLDVSLALAAVCRAKGIPAKFCRILNHSAVVFFNGEKWLKADIHEGGRILEFSEKNLDWIERQKKKPLGKRLYAEGLDAWDIGIHSLKDFLKYYPKKAL